MRSSTIRGLEYLLARLEPVGNIGRRRVEPHDQRLLVPVEQPLAGGHVDERLGLVRREPVAVERQRHDELALGHPVGPPLAKRRGHGRLQTHLVNGPVGSGVTVAIASSDLACRSVEQYWWGLPAVSAGPCVECYFVASRVLGPDGSHN